MRISDWSSDVCSSDLYFLKTKAAVGRFGDKAVTYAVFMRRPVISAPRLAVDWLRQMAKARGTEVDIEVNYAEGRWVGAGEPIQIGRASCRERGCQYV